MVIYGSLLAMSDSKLSEQIAIDPIGALTSILPTWYLIPFAVVAVLGLVGGAILDLYSSGITMVSLGVPLKRHQAAFIDGLIMTFGTIYFVWFADDFFLPFQGFLITLGVPIAAWSGIFVADILLRKKDYAEKENLLQTDSREEIEKWIDEVLKAHPDKVTAYKNGKKGLLGVFVGEVKKMSKGKADPQITTTLLEQKLT